MKVIFPLFFGIALLISTNALSNTPQHIPKPPNIAAKSYILLDFNSGHVITDKHPNERMEPASLTKMMASYVVASEIEQGRLSLADSTRVSKKAWRMRGSRMFIEAGKTVDIASLIKGMVIQSGNDATIALAEHIAGSEQDFVKLMNEYAQRLGMADTRFANATGLPGKGEHYSTANDLARLSIALIRDFPQHYAVYSGKSFRFNNITQHNRNDLLWRDQSVDGIKTGFTDSAGYCLAASAKRGNMRLISIVLGTKSEKSRSEEALKLLTYGFRFYETHKLFTALEPLTEAPVFKGETENLQMGIADDLYVTIPRGQYDKLKASMTFDAVLVAPINKHDPLGQVKVELGTHSFAQRQLIGLTDVAPGGFWHNFMDSIRLWLNGH